MRSLLPLTKEQIEYLEKLYYGKDYYFGRTKLFKIIKEEGSNISRRQLWDWLKKQEIHQLYSRHNKPKDVKRTILKRPLAQIGIDLIDMQNQQYNDYQYIFTAIDLFSKKAYAVPLKNKEKKEVERALKEIYKFYSKDGKISAFRSDNGSEFISDSFRLFIKSKDIKHIFSLPGKPQSNGSIERFNGIIKKLINKYLISNNTKDWVSGLKKLVSNYNNTYQNTIKTEPNSVDYITKKEVAKNIENNVGMKNDNQTPRFEVGDKVRVKIFNQKNGMKFSKDRYTISKVFRNKSGIQAPFYYLAEDPKKKYYNEDLIWANDVLNENEIPGEWKVKRIVRPTVKNGKPYYEVEWVGYKDTTLESRKKLKEDVNKLVKAFDRQHDVFWYKSNGMWEYNWKK